MSVCPLLVIIVSLVFIQGCRKDFWSGPVVIGAQPFFSMSIMNFIKSPKKWSGQNRTSSPAHMPMQFGSPCSQLGLPTFQFFTSLYKQAWEHLFCEWHQCLPSKQRGKVSNQKNAFRAHVLNNEQQFGTPCNAWLNTAKTKCSFSWGPSFPLSN